MPSIFNSASLTQAAAIIALGIATASPSLAQSQLQTQMTPQKRSEARAIMQACRGDYDRLCDNVTPGGGRILACLQSHAGQLSSSCAQALPRAQALRDGAISAGVSPK